MSTLYRYYLTILVVFKRLCSVFVLSIHEQTKRSSFWSTTVNKIAILADIFRGIDLEESWAATPSDGQAKIWNYITSWFALHSSPSSSFIRYNDDTMIGMQHQKHSTI
jgi:hypothetical protein